MLAAQMVGVHWTAMALLSKVGSTNDRALLNDVGNLAVKLLRTYTTQLEALKRYRSAGEQRVVVQHVNVTADQAAVQVNPVPSSRGEGGGIETGGTGPSTAACPCIRARYAVPGPGAERHASYRL